MKLGRLAAKHLITWMILGMVFVSGAHAYSLYGRAGDVDTWVTFVIWVVVMVLGAGLLRAVEKGSERTRKEVQGRASPFWAVALIIVAFGLRVVWLERAPANVGGDESMQAVLAREFAEGENDNIFGVSLWYDTPNFYYFVSSIPFLWVSDSIFWWRFQAVIIGTATVYLLYLVVKRWFGFKAGLIAGALLAVNHVHIHFSRIGAHQLTDGFFAVLIPWLFTRTLDSQRYSNAFLLGIVMALSQRFYFGMWLLPLMLLAALAYLAMASRHSLWKWLKRCGPAMLLGIWIGSYPFALSYQGSVGSYLTRVSQVLIFDVRVLLEKGTLVPNSKVAFDLAERLRILIIGLVTPQLRGWYEPPYAWMSAVGFVLFGAGLLVILKRMRSSISYGLVLLMAFMPLLAVGLLTDNPLTSQRLLISVVWLTAIQALGLIWGWRLLEEWKPGNSYSLGQYFAGTVLVFVVVISLFRYFVFYTPERSYGFANTLRVTEISRAMNDMNGGCYVALLGGGRISTRGFADFRFLNREIVYSDHVCADDAFWQGAVGYDAVVATTAEEEGFAGYVRRYGGPEGEVVEAYYRPSRTLPALVSYYLADRQIIGGEYEVYSATEWMAPPDDIEPLFYMYWAHGFNR